IRDAGFSLFYSGINIGALLGGYACVAIGKEYSWHLAFALAGIVMTISVVTFLFTQKSLGPIGLPPSANVPLPATTEKDLSTSTAEEQVVEVKAARTRPQAWKTYAVYLGSLA